VSIKNAPGLRPYLLVSQSAKCMEPAAKAEKARGAGVGAFADPKRFETNELLARHCQAKTDCPSA